MSEWSRKLEDVRNWTDENISQPLTINPGWSGRLAHGAVQTVKDAGAGLAEAGKIVGGALDEHVAEPMQRELYEGEAAYRKLNEAPTYQMSKDFGKDYLQKNISKMFGEDGSLKIKEGLATNYTAAEREAALAKIKAQSDVDKTAADTAQPTGPVNDPNVTATSKKVATATAGGDPTASDKGAEEAKKVAEGAVDEGDLITKAVDKTAQDMHTRNITPENWYESDAFRLGLIRFGLGLMSGEDYATAFSSAANDYSTLDGKQKRESYTDELLADGYRQADIMEWINKGDASVLKLPEVKDTYEQFTQKDGSLWQRNVNTKAISKLSDGAKPVSGIMVQEGGRQKLVNPTTGAVIATYGAKDPDTTGGSLLGIKGVGGTGGAGGKMTDTQRNRGSLGMRAIEGAKGLNYGFQAASDDYNNSMLNGIPGGDAVLRGHFANIMADAESASGTYGVSWLKSNYPGFAEYSGVLNNTLNAVMRSDSGAVIGNAEQRKYVAGLAPMPWDSPKTQDYKKRNMENAILEITAQGNPMVAEAMYLTQSDPSRFGIALTSEGAVLYEMGPDGKVVNGHRLYRK